MATCHIMGPLNAYSVKAAGSSPLPLIDEAQDDHKHHWPSVDTTTPESSLILEICHGRISASSSQHSN